MRFDRRFNDMVCFNSNNIVNTKYSLNSYSSLGAIHKDPAIHRWIYTYHYASGVR